MSNKPAKCTPSANLHMRLMSACEPKSEVEWYAKRLIEELEQQLFAKLCELQIQDNANEILQRNNAKLAAQLEEMRKREAMLVAKFDAICDLVWHREDTRLSYKETMEVLHIAMTALKPTAADTEAFLREWAVKRLGDPFGYCHRPSGMMINANVEDFPQSDLEPLYILPD